MLWISKLARKVGAIKNESRLAQWQKTCREFSNLTTQYTNLQLQRSPFQFFALFQATAQDEVANTEFYVRQKDESLEIGVLHRGQQLFEDALIIPSKEEKRRLTKSVDHLIQQQTEHAFRYIDKILLSQKGKRHSRPLHVESFSTNSAWEIAAIKVGVRQEFQDAIIEWSTDREQQFFHSDDQKNWFFTFRPNKHEARSPSFEKSDTRSVLAPEHKKQIKKAFQQLRQLAKESLCH